MNYFIVNQKDRMIWADVPEPIAPPLPDYWTGSGIARQSYNDLFKEYEWAMDKYNSRPHYPYSTELNWIDQQRVEEGKDFDIRWTNGLATWFGDKVSNHDWLIALPSKDKEEKTEDELNVAVDRGMKLVKELKHKTQLALDEGSPYHETAEARTMAFEHGWDACKEYFGITNSTTIPIKEPIEMKEEKTERMFTPVPFAVSFVDWISEEGWMRLSKNVGHKWFKAGIPETFTTLELLGKFEKEII